MPSDKITFQESAAGRHGNSQPKRYFVEIIASIVPWLFRHLPFTGANDEKVGLLGLVPGVAAAAQPDPGLSSFALLGLRIGTCNVFHGAPRRLGYIGLVRGSELPASGSDLLRISDFAF
jgi:hypothetical protein